MFKNLFAFLDASYEMPTTDFEKFFFDNLKRFAFYDELNKKCKTTHGKDIAQLVEAGSHKAIVATLLHTDGLNYGQLPKGLLLFHKYAEGERTAMEEHLVEAAQYAACGTEAHVHFTVSHEHLELFKAKAAQKQPMYEENYRTRFSITFSEQKPSTDTVAANPDNTPFRNDDGSLLFRPGGHGALIQNLNDIDADVVFIKNIDNVTPDRLKPEARMRPQALKHLVDAAPRVMVVDGSKLVRKLIADVLQRELPQVEVVGCACIEDARQALDAGPVNLVTTSLTLSDGDGLALARMVREAAGQAYVPVIVVSGDAQQHLEQRRFTEYVTDYFDKALGHEALASFIKGYVQPETIPGATILYIEDSRVVAEATKRMLERQSLNVLHVMTAEEAFALLTAESLGRSNTRIDLVLTDVTLKGELSGRDVVERVRVDFGYGKRRLPVLVMTGDGNPHNQSGLLQSGANDLVQKPIEERLLVTKVLFQLRLARLNDKPVLR